MEIRIPSLLELAGLAAYQKQPSVGNIHVLALLSGPNCSAYFLIPGSERSSITTCPVVNDLSWNREGTRMIEPCYWASLPQ